MNKALKTAIAASMLTMASTAFAQYSVAVIADIPATAHQIETLAQWAKQYAQMVSQLNQLKQQYEAITGARGLGQIMNSPALRAYLPDQWAGIYDKVKGGSLPGIASVADSIYASEGFDSTATGGRKRQLDVMAANKAMAMQAYDAALARVNNINALMAKADTAVDSKASADLQNRMAAENAMIQNEQIRLNLARQLQATEAQLADKQADREFEQEYFK